jgi:hypothetical protein
MGASKSCQQRARARILNLPAHPGLFETGINQMLTSRLNRARADLEIEFSIVSIVYAGEIVVLQLIGI